MQAQCKWSYADTNPAAFYNPVRWSEKKLVGIVLAEILSANPYFQRPVHIKFYQGAAGKECFKVTSQAEFMEKCHMTQGGTASTPTDHHLRASVADLTRTCDAAAEVPKPEEAKQPSLQGSLNLGVLVEAKQDFYTDDDASTEKIKEGQCGVVHRVDADGDAVILFDGIKQRKLVKKINFHCLQELPSVEIGDRVRANNVMIMFASADDLTYAIYEESAHAAQQGLTLPDERNIASCQVLTDAILVEPMIAVNFKEHASEFGNYSHWHVSTWVYSNYFKSCSGAGKIIFGGLCDDTKNLKHCLSYAPKVSGENIVFFWDTCSHFETTFYILTERHCIWKGGFMASVEVCKIEDIDLEESDDSLRLKCGRSFTCLSKLQLKLLVAIAKALKA
jgi:hypothetical protein